MASHNPSVANFCPSSRWLGGAEGCPRAVAGATCRSRSNHLLSRSDDVLDNPLLLAQPFRPLPRLAGGLGLAERPIGARHAVPIPRGHGDGRRLVGASLRRQREAQPQVGLANDEVLVGGPSLFEQLVQRQALGRVRRRRWWRRRRWALSFGARRSPRQR